MLVGEDPRFPLGKRGARPLRLRIDPSAARRVRDLLPGSVYSGGYLTFSWEALSAARAVLGDVGQFEFSEPVVALPGLEEYRRCFATKLRGYQKVMLQFLVLRAYAINADPMRCLDGDTQITVNRGGCAKIMTLRRLVQGFSGQLKWDLTIPTRIQSMDTDGTIRLNTVTAAHQPGQKLCCKVLLTDGSHLWATLEHEFATPNGMVALGNLHVGDFVCRAVWPEKKSGPRAQNDSRYLQGFDAHPFAEKFSQLRTKRRGRAVTPFKEPVARCKKHRLAAEAKLNGLSFAEFIRVVRSGEVQGLKFLDPVLWHVHHLDGNHRNDAPENLEVMTQEEHSRRHAIEGAWKHVSGKAVPVQIASLGPGEMREVFDLTMTNPLNNYVANGIVVSNSGKTPTTLAAASLIGSKKTLVVCPAIAKLVWCTEIVKWLGLPSLLLYGRAGDEAREFCVACNGSGHDSVGKHCPVCKTKNGQSFGTITHRTREGVIEMLDKHRFIIANYDVLTPQMQRSDAGVRSERKDLPGWHELLTNRGLDLCIIDEAHILRGRSKRDRVGESRRDKLISICNPVERVWGLTGTPIFGRVADLWAMLDVITNGLFGRPFFSFDVHYTNGHKGEYGWVNDGMTNPEQLKSRLDSFLLKRDRKEILPELPPKTRQIIRIDAGKSSFKPLKSGGGGGIHAALRVTAAIKEPYVVEAVANECAENAKVVVYTHGVEHAQLLAQAIADASQKDPRLKLRNMRVWCITGSVSTEARFKQAQAFREWVGAAAFVATIESVPVAISLKGAQSVHFADMTFDPASLLQAEDRPYEVGITNGLAIVYYVVEKTIDEHVVEIVMPKMEMLENVMAESAATDFKGAFGSQLTPEQMAEEIWTRMEASAL